MPDQSVSGINRNQSIDFNILYNRVLETIIKKREHKIKLQRLLFLVDAVK